jgi:hypothetical protein
MLHGVLQSYMHLMEYNCLPSSDRNSFSGICRAPEVMHHPAPYSLNLQLLNIPTVVSSSLQSSTLALYQCCAGFTFFICQWVSVFKENLELDTQRVMALKKSKGIEVMSWNFAMVYV